MSSRMISKPRILLCYMDLSQPAYRGFRSGFSVLVLTKECKYSSICEINISHKLWFVNNFIYFSLTLCNYQLDKKKHKVSLVLSSPTAKITSSSDLYFPIFRIKE